jgi:hypothetical protein
MLFCLLLSSTTFTSTSSSSSQNNARVGGSSNSLWSLECGEGCDRTLKTNNNVKGVGGGVTSSQLPWPESDAAARSKSSQQKAAKTHSHQNGGVIRTIRVALKPDRDSFFFNSNRIDDLGSDGAGSAETVASPSSLFPLTTLSAPSVISYVMVS